MDRREDTDAAPPPPQAHHAVSSAAVFSGGGWPPSHPHPEERCSQLLLLWLPGRPSSFEVSLKHVLTVCLLTSLLQVAALTSTLSEGGGDWIQSSCFGGLCAAEIKEKSLQPEVGTACGRV